MDTISSQTTELHYDFGLELERKALSDDGEVLTISGRASTWNLDRDGDQMSRDAFSRSLAKYMSTNPIVLYNHKYSQPMGITTQAEVKADGLHVTVQLPRPPAGTEALNIWNLVKKGVIRAFSVGGKPTRSRVGGKAVITDWDLSEISIASVGVNPETLFNLKTQVGKAFGDPVAAGSLEGLDRARLRAYGQVIDALLLDDVRRDLRDLAKAVA